MLVEQRSDPHRQADLGFVNRYRHPVRCNQ